MEQDGDRPTVFFCSNAITEYHNQNPMSKIAKVTINQKVYRTMIDEQVAYASDPSPKRISDPLNLNSVFSLPGVVFEVSATQQEPIKIEGGSAVYTRDSDGTSLRLG